MAGDNTDSNDELSADKLKDLLEKLTGQQLPLEDKTGVLAQVSEYFSNGHPLGYSQFNELLLNVGYDRVVREFFEYLCDPAISNGSGEGVHEINNHDSLKRGINAFRELALLLFGNVKYGFKVLSCDPEALKLFIQDERSERSDRDFKSRHAPLVELRNISAEEAHLLGYISGKEIEASLKKDPTNSMLLDRKKRRDEVIEDGKWNHNIYLTSDHLDVYVATSMREPHEYAFVKHFMSQIEKNKHIVDLCLRIFDPTAAYCEKRIDKGLAEALMLKRAKCTVYLAQESDTLGKDSELASTLAQGKPVIAFVPKVDDKSWNALYDIFKKSYAETSLDEESLLLKLLQIYKPDSAWKDEVVKKHLLKIEVIQNDKLIEMVKAAVMSHYDKRAEVLCNTHPLGLQTNLRTGVANGVLVVRNFDDCAKLIKKIILNKMDFYVEDDGGYVYLKESTTQCVFRVMTADKLLTNSFWNFYHMKSEDG